ncbi:MAG: Ppx/GppA family phosphatase [Rickettsiaceae bacterium]
MRCAIMDIGYNAIRAVVYDNNKLGAAELFNYKFKTDILCLLSQDSFDVKHQTYLSIQYLLHIFHKLNVLDIRCIATAVLRNHPRAQDFVDYIKLKYGLEITVVSGQQEAHLMALGLMSGITDSNGIAADLGGGSLELVGVNNGKVGQLASFALGIKMMTLNNITTVNELIEIIKQEFQNKTYKNLYFVGGSLRFIGRTYIDANNISMKNLHYATILSSDLTHYINKIKSTNNCVSKNRSNRIINKNSILMTEALLTIFKPEQIIISNYGLKEGVRLELLSAEDRNSNIIEAKLLEVCNCNISLINLDSYYKIIKTLISEANDSILELLKYAIILSSLRKNFDSTIPSKGISEYVLASEIPFKSDTRMMLAVILEYFSQHKPNAELIQKAKQCISKKEYAICQIIGHFLYITQQIDGSDFSTPSFSIENNNSYLQIVWPNKLPRPIFDKVCIRLKYIASARKYS